MKIIPRISATTMDRIRLLRDNLIDLSVAIDDLDAEIAPRLAERDNLVAMLHDARVELETMLERIAA